MKGLSSVSPMCLVLITVVISIIFIDLLSTEEQNVVGNVLIAIGSIIIVSASQGAFLAGMKDNQAQRELLERQLELLNRKKPSR
ncbi:MAG TPA: hypothetical protein VHT96_05620 [Clostridia bacterium]|nr:hypothetical protein [Clostridia bacterium]